MTTPAPSLPRQARALACCGLALCLGVLWVATPLARRQASGTPATGAGVRVFSWNVSDDAFVEDPTTFRALVDHARADILLLDEVAPTTTPQQLRAALSGATGGAADWHVEYGESGGRQRGVIASRLPLERVPELSAVVPYPDGERRRLVVRMTATGQNHQAFGMDGGIAVNGAIVSVGARRLLVVTTDLQCCGDDPASWQEERRRLEATEIRRRVRQALTRTRVDGVILAGDFNVVSTPVPLAILSGPYDPPHAGLIAADLAHPDGSDRWTWDGTGTPFPSRPMDFVLYAPNALVLRDGYVLDAADLPPPDLARVGLRPEAAARLSAHRPLVAAFDWR